MEWFSSVVLINGFHLMPLSLDDSLQVTLFRHRFFLCCFQKIYQTKGDLSIIFFMCQWDQWGVNFVMSLPSVGVMECFAFQALDMFFLARDHSISAARPMMTQMVRARPSAVYTWRRAFFLPRSSSSFARSSGSSV